MPAPANVCIVASVRRDGGSVDISVAVDLSLYEFLNEAAVVSLDVVDELKAHLRRSWCEFLLPVVIVGNSRTVRELVER